MIVKITLHDERTCRELLQEQYPYLNGTFGLPDDVYGKTYYAATRETFGVFTYEIHCGNYTFQVLPELCKKVDKNFVLCEACAYDAKRWCFQGGRTCDDCLLADERLTCKCTLNYDKYNNTCRLFNIVKEAIPDGN